MSFIVGNKYAKLSFEAINKKREHKIVTIKVPMIVIINTNKNNIHRNVLDIFDKYCRKKLLSSDVEYHSSIDYVIDSLYVLVDNANLITGE